MPPIISHQRVVVEMMGVVVERDTGQVQVESILLVSPFVPADELLDDGSHVGEPGGGEEGGEGG